MSEDTVNIAFTLDNPWEFPRYGMPLRCSVPLPIGIVRDPAAQLALLDEAGHDVVAQWRVLSTWNDGSARFALMDYAAGEIEPRSSRKLKLISCERRKSGQAIAEATGRAAIKVQEDRQSLTVDTGRLKWVFSKTAFTLAKSIQFSGREWIDGRESDLFVVDTNGQIFRAMAGRYSIRLEEKGPYRVIVLIEGDYANPTGKFMDYKMRLHFTAGGSQVLLSHTIRNRHAGREGKSLVRSSLTGAINVGPKAIRRVQHITRGLNTIQAVVEIPENVDLDTGTYQTTIRNIASLREDPKDICYSVEHGTDIGRYGSCAALIDLHEPGVGGMLFKFAMPDPPREFPVRLGSHRDRFEIDFYPECEEPMHLNEGMGKTRDVLLNFHDDSLGGRDLVYESDNLSYPGVVGVLHEIYRKAQFADIEHTLVQQLNKYPMLESKIDMLLAAPKAFDWPVATGWRDWGDEVGARGRAPELGVVQYINNEEDYLFCLMTEAWRTGKPYGGATMARHLMDIDYIDYSPDPARDGANCPHSTGHTNGETYPSHMWCQGLLYFYLATGDEEALRISKRIGDCLVWWINGPRSDALNFSGRESAWPLLSLAALYEITHEQKYRDAGMVIVNDLQEKQDKFGQLVWEYPPGSGIHSGYMSAMTFNGIWDMYRASGDEKVLELWKTVTRPVIEKLSDPTSWGYIHFRNWPIKWPDLTNLARWYHLTQDRKYADLGKNCMRLVLSGAPQALQQTQGIIAMGYRHFIYFLKIADELGMINDDHCVLVW